MKMRNKLIRINNRTNFIFLTRKQYWHLHEFHYEIIKELNDKFTARNKSIEGYSYEGKKIDSQLIEQVKYFLNN